jgi:hypothetical protein
MMPCLASLCVCTASVLQCVLRTATVHSDKLWPLRPMKVFLWSLISTTNFIINILLLATCTSCDRLPLTFMLESGCATLNYTLYAQIFLQPQFVRQRERYLLYYMLSVELLPRPQLVPNRKSGCDFLTHTKGCHNIHTLLHGLLHRSFLFSYTYQNVNLICRSVAI